MTCNDPADLPNCEIAEHFDEYDWNTADKSDGWEMSLS